MWSTTLSGIQIMTSLPSFFYFLQIAYVHVHSIYSYMLYIIYNVRKRSAMSIANISLAGKHKEEYSNVKEFNCAVCIDRDRFFFSLHVCI